MLSFLLMLLSSFPSMAAPASTQNVEKLLNVMHAELVVKAMQAEFDNMQTQLSSRLPGKPDEKRRKDFQSEMKKLVDDFRGKNLNYATLKPGFVKIYQEAWSDEEIKSLIGFYESPVGKKVVDTMPALMQKTNTMVQSQVASHSMELNSGVQKLIMKYYPELAPKPQGSQP